MMKTARSSLLKVNPQTKRHTNLGEREAYGGWCAIVVEPGVDDLRLYAARIRDFVSSKSNTRLSPGGRVLGLTL